MNLPEKTKLTLAEKRLLAAYEKNEFQSLANPEEKKNLRAAARTTTLKDQRINIRMSSEDLQNIRDIAREEGLPYQSLISSVLHKYATGRLVERKRSVRDNKRSR
jgi:predicted DNA binding CopG/RHH family protein